MANTRFAVLALPYSMQELGYPKEIMCDYETGHFYVKTEDGLSIVSITKELEDKLKNITSPAGGDTIGVSVIGMEETTLNPVLNEFKKYIDAIHQGLVIKGPAEVLCDYNIPLYGLPSQIDGVTIKDGLKVLLIAQTNKAENGLWVAHTKQWIRSTDFDQNSEIENTPYVFIESGSVYKQSGWIMTTPNPIEFGVTEIEFKQFSGIGLIKSGDGIEVNDNTISLEPLFDREQTGNTITIDRYGRVKSISRNIIGYTTNRVIISAGDAGVITSSNITTSELNTLSSARSNIQEQLDSKNSFDIATQEQAEFGSDNITGMTPLRVKQFLMANSLEFGGFTNVVFQSGKKYWKYIADAEVSKISIPLDQYNPLLDTVEVIQNSNIPLILNENYTLSGNEITLLGYTIQKDEVLHFLITNTSFDYNALSNKPIIVNDLVTGGADALASAEQIKLLNERINTLILENNLVSIKGYTHTQTTPAKLWVITHNMDKYPSVTVVDPMSNVVVGDVAYITTDELVISFTSEFSGKAYLN